MSRPDVDPRYAAAPYEPLSVPRMWGVFRIGEELSAPIALFSDETRADAYHHNMIRKSQYAVLAVDGITGHVWNDIDPPPA